MNHFKRLFIFCLILLFVRANVFATVYYLDCGAGSDGAGTYASPYKYKNSITLANSDSVYFKENVTCTIDANFTVPWNITNSGVTIGCYNGDGDFDCENINYLTGANYPVIDGTNTYPSNSYDEFIQIRAANVTVQDLKLINSEGGGISADGSGAYSGDSATIQRLWVQTIYRQGIAGNDSDNSTFTQNVITDSNRISIFVTGLPACVTGVVTTPDGNCTTYCGAAMTCDGGCEDTTMSLNRIYGNYGEGMGGYRNYNTAAPLIIEKNLSMNNRSAQIHARDSDAIIRYNLVGFYDTGGDSYEPTWVGGTYPNCGTTRNQISSVIDAGSTDSGGQAYTTTLKIYGNLVFGGSNSPGISCPLSSASRTQGDVLTFYVYNNTLVDNNPNFRFNENGDDGTTSYVKNNISAFYNTSPNHAEINSSKVSLDNNFWSSEPADADAKGGNDLAYANPQLAIQTGYRWPASLITFDGSEFALLGSSSAIDEGEDLISYDNMIDPNTVDFTLLPPNIDLLDGSLYGVAHDIGAMVYALYMSDFTPSSGATEQNITVDGNWTNPTGTNSNTIYLDKKADHDPPTTEIHSGTAVETHDFGTLDESTEYAWRNDIVHDGGTQTGVVYYFTTTDALPQTPPGQLPQVIIGTGGAPVAVDGIGSTLLLIGQ